MDEHKSVDYRRKAIPYSFNQRLVRPQQQRLYEMYARVFPPSPALRVLDLGVNGSLEDAEEYFFEANYPHAQQVVALGLEGPELFQQFYPRSRYVQGSRDGRLPFRDGEFDVVFCNAVIEHVGSRQRQAEFLKETLRVGRCIFLTTPNRWFPVELHTVLPLVHYLPTACYRWIFDRIGFGFFAKEENLNLLDAKALSALVPANLPHRILRHWFLGFPSNLILVIAR